MANGAAAIHTAVENAPPPPRKATKKPVIRIEPGKLFDNATAAEAAIIKTGFPIYRRGALLVRPVVEEIDASHGRETCVAQLTRIEPPYLRDVLCRVAEWKRSTSVKKAGLRLTRRLRSP